MLYDIEWKINKICNGYSREKNKKKKHLSKTIHGCQNKSPRIQKALFQLSLEGGHENGEGISFLSLLLKL